MMASSVTTRRAVCHPITRSKQNLSKAAISHTETFKTRYTSNFNANPDKPINKFAETKRDPTPTGRPRHAYLQISTTTDNQGMKGISKDSRLRVSENGLKSEHYRL